MTQFRLSQRPGPVKADAPTTAVPTPLPAPESKAKTAVAEALPGDDEASSYLLHFEPLSATGAGLDIPCDPQGRVGLDALGDKVRNDYFFARALIGRLFARPTVRAALPLHHA